MKHALIALSMFVSGCATTQGGGVTVPISVERAAQCKAGGGCGLFTADEIVQMFLELTPAICKGI